MVCFLGTKVLENQLLAPVINIENIVAKSVHALIGPTLQLFQPTLDFSHPRERDTVVFLLEELAVEGERDLVLTEIVQDRHVLIVHLVLHESHLLNVFYVLDYMLLQGVVVIVIVVEAFGNHLCLH